jgi:hypothetical protein
LNADPEHVAGAWDVAPKNVVRPERGWNNLVWVLDDAYVLRVYLNLTAERVGAEHRLLEEIRQRLADLTESLQRGDTL